MGWSLSPDLGVGSGLGLGSGSGLGLGLGLGRDAQAIVTMPLDVRVHFSRHRTSENADLYNFEMQITICDRPGNG